MEVFSAVSGAITLLEVATRINKLCVTVKDAPNDWKRYRDGLHAVTCIQNVLATVLSNCPAIRSLVVPADTQQSQIPFTDHVNGVLSEVKEQAKNLLERHGQLSGGWARKQISRVFKPLGFIVDRERIEKMIESVEQAHHHLHMALTLASIKASSSCHSPDTSNAIRVEDVIASLSESEWDETRGMQMEELIEFLSTHATAQPTAYATDVEITTTSSTVPPIRLCTDRESYLLMAKPVDLALCSLEQDSTVAIFCVTEVHITDGMQLFSSVQSTTDDYSDAKTERAPSEAGSDGGHETESDQPRGEEDVANGGATFPMRPDAVDDERAFELLRMMAVDEAYVLPSEVEWDVLVRFLRLVDKYGQHVGEKPLAQARLWASLIPPSKTFDENAILWLWVMWKLQMIEEFWELSAVNLISGV
ncbi:hypothetical protein B0T26DRAFT_751558 [Lasiosphaeria miniovina]|uniref:Uncharacterized protein n=1 Tax=Lasiosphaeria miniovina TaxID=1954250 RepID=A0AA40DV49_9PEZI|nr:uncharacterized protein B0T26DRAFT_751558 [Lasiosphaeria miniovina]KAK0717514.1 hypothetical protein B0T26DRAFT_751558 [Lasiosphaeria miniovina]